MPITVSQLQIAPVKGLRVTPVDEVELTPSGPRGDRGYGVIDAKTHKLALTTRNRSLLRIAAGIDPASGELTLKFPGGDVVSEVPQPGEPATTAVYDGREVAGRLVAPGPLTDALAKHFRRGVRLIAFDPEETRGDDAPVTLMSRASLEALAPALDGQTPDARRFRMTITIDGAGAWEEHGWSGRELEVGEARLAVVDPVPRCAVTTHGPETGDRDLPVLKALAELRGKKDVTFGVWCRVVDPGRVRIGDSVALRD
jgi:hypothetical protein